MRVWDLPPSGLCLKHLLGEHREIHCIYSFLTTDKGGSYKHHPETLRWIGKLDALKVRHDALVREMLARGYTGHKSPLPYTGDSEVQDAFLATPEEQIAWIKTKGCNCNFA